MGMGSEQTTQGQAGPQSAQARSILDTFAGIASGSAAQMGDMTDIAAGNFNITPEQQAMINEAQNASGGVARSNMDQNMEQVLRQLEDANIGKQITGGSLEAVNNALVGQQGLRDTDMLNMQQQGQAAEMGLNTPFQAANSQVQANQALMQRLVGTGGATLNYDAAIRDMNASGTQNTEQGFGASLVQTGNMVGNMIPGGGGGSSTTKS
jgi:hypothetical protein